MDNNILVIGNGFDLHHNLKTKYFDFVEFTKNSIDMADIPDEIKNKSQNNIFLKYFQKVCEVTRNWIDCEKEIENMVYVIQDLVNVWEQNEKGEATKAELHNTAYINLARQLIQPKFMSWNQGKCKADKKYYKINVFRKDEFMDDLRKELQDVIEVLSFYLKKEENNVCNKDAYKQIVDINPRQIINFNYTKTYSKIYSDKIPVLYIHGSLEDESSIVLGIPDSEKISLDFVYFKKYFQRIQKRTPSLRTIDFTSHEGIDRIKPTIYFLGLSMGRTDEDIIKKIIHESLKSIIFYYDQGDYESKVINLIDIYGRSKIEEMIEDQKIEFVKLDKNKA